MEKKVEKEVNCFFILELIGQKGGRNQSNGDKLFFMHSEL